MKALTVKNPWAWLICSGAKDVENRSWRTSFRGRVLIHVAQSLATPDIALDVSYTHVPSAIIGSVEIIDCIKDSSSPWAFAGYWHWVLRRPVLFDEPILNIRGSLSFWKIPERVGISC
ncbi:ASCH domain-containing protein [Patescibacteria group bacterium]|nr:ASCH domain-containing protein [Patescibacteria group bacterium]